MASAEQCRAAGSGLRGRGSGQGRGGATDNGVTYDAIQSEGEDRTDCQLCTEVTESRAPV